MSTSLKISLTLVMLVLLGYTGFTLVRISSRQSASAEAGFPADEAPRDFSELEMTERSGRPFDFAELDGKVWVASTFYTTCSTECPSLNKTLAALQNDPEFAEVRFVSISVDPAADTPEVMQNTASSFGADPDRWFFLVGGMRDIKALAAILGLSAGYKTHTGRLVVLDRTGQRRGTFLFSEPKDMHDIRVLLAELVQKRSVAESE